MMLRVLFITSYLFLLFQYSESLMCNGKNYLYSSFSVQPVLIWDLETQTEAGDQKKIDDFRKAVEMQFTTLERQGVGSFLGPASAESSDAVASRWGGNYYAETVAPIVANPPSIASATSMTMARDGAFELLKTEPLRPVDKVYVRWPLLFTDKGPRLEEPNKMSPLKNSFGHLSVITLNSAAAANLWRASWIPRAIQSLGFLSVFSLSLSQLPTSGEGIKEVPVLKHLLTEMDKAFCSSVLVASGTNVVPPTVTEGAGTPVLSAAGGDASNMVLQGKSKINYKTVSAGAAGLGFLALAGLTCLFCSSKMKEKTSIIKDDQDDDWNNFSYEENGEPKLYVDGGERQNSMEWIQLK